MKILVYGAGVIGSIFAGKLVSSGNEVSVLARGKRYEEIKEKGIILIDADNGKKEQYKVNLIDQLLPDMKFDYIIVAMNNKQVKEVLPILERNCSQNIVIMANTAAGYDQWTQYIRKDKLMIGFPCAGGGKTDGEISYFIGSGFVRMFQTTTLGELSGKKTKRVTKLIKEFCTAGIPTVFCSDMDAWQKTHVAIIISIADSLYGYNGDNYKMAKSHNAVREMVEGMKEGFKVIESCNMKVTPAKLFWLKLPNWFLTFGFSIYMNTKLAEVGMAEHSMAAKDENIELQNEFDKLIKKSGVKTPVLDKLRKNISKI